MEEPRNKASESERRKWKHGSLGQRAYFTCVFVCCCCDVCVQVFVIDGGIDESICLQRADGIHDLLEGEV